MDRTIGDEICKPIPEEKRTRTNEVYHTCGPATKTRDICRLNNRGKLDNRIHGVNLILGMTRMAGAPREGHALGKRGSLLAQRPDTIEVVPGREEPQGATQS